MKSVQTDDWLHDIFRNEEGDVHDNLVNHVRDLLLLTWKNLDLPTIDTDQLECSERCT